MKPCQMAGGCPKHREAVLTARIRAIGDRPLCRECFDWLRSQMGEDCRELDTNAYVPAWRARGLARDMTGRVLV